MYTFVRLECFEFFARVIIFIFKPRFLLRIREFVGMNPNVCTARGPFRVAISIFATVRSLGSLFARQNRNLLWALFGWLGAAQEIGKANIVLL